MTCNLTDLVGVLTATPIGGGDPLTLNLSSDLVENDGGFSSGILDYELLDEFDMVIESGEWHLFPVDIAGSGTRRVNTHDGTQLAWWANNFDNVLGPPGGSFLNRGIDLAGLASPVPEPGTLALFGGALVLCLRRRRRSTS